MIFRERFVPWLLSAIAAFATSPAQPQQTESLVVDPGTGDYVVTYCCNSDGSMAQAVLEPATKVKPAVTSRFALQASEYVKYEYGLHVLPDSPKGLDAFRLDPVTSIKTTVPVPAKRSAVTRSEWAAAREALAEQMSSPPGWQASATLSNKSPGLRLSWRRPGFGGEAAPAGTRHFGFGFESLDLPGVAVGQLTSRARVWSFANEGPDPNGEVGQQLSQLEENDFVPRFIAAPMLPIPNPFKAATVLQGLRDHARTWPQRQLMDQALWQTVDAYLDSAIKASKGSDPASATVALARIRVELRKRYPDLDLSTVYDDPSVNQTSPVSNDSIGVHDRRLAARVLDFDVGFVMGKVGMGAFPYAADGTILAPPVDADGTFKVVWGSPVAGVQTVCPATSVGCKELLLGYVLEAASDPKFATARPAYEGMDKEFTTAKLAPGAYFFRVKAHMYRCRGPSSLSWEDWSCDVGQGEPADTGYYAIGPNSTIVAGQ